MWVLSSKQCDSHVSKFTRAQYHLPPLLALFQRASFVVTPIHQPPPHARLRFISLNFSRSYLPITPHLSPPCVYADGWLWATLDQGAGILDSALNNLSLAMVYSCDVMRGVETLEGLIRKDPRLYMLDVVIFNLCTLYDLSFDAVASAKKKRTLQAVAQRFRLEDIDAASFRMS